MTENKKPAVRFQGFAENWKQWKLGDICEIVGGGTPNTSNPEYWDGDIDWYTPGEMEGQRYAVGSVKKITELGLQKSSAKILPSDKTVLFTSRAGIGKMAILQNPGSTNQGFQSMIFKEGYNPYFIYSMGNVIKKKVESVASGSTFLEISGKMLGNIEIMIPQKKEQDIISNFFENLDNFIIFHQHKCEKLQNIKKSMLEKMFPQNGNDVSEIRFQGFTDAWEQRKLGETVEIIGTGKSKFTSDLVKSEITPYAVLGSTSVISFDSRYDYSGDFILTARVGANAGELYKYSGNVKISDNTVFIQSENLQFIFYLLTKFNLKNLSFGTGQPLIKASELSNLFLMFPTNTEEQFRIGTFFSNLDNLIILHQKKIEKLQNIKKSYLEKMFV